MLHTDGGHNVVVEKEAIAQYLTELKVNVPWKMDAFITKTNKQNILYYYSTSA